LNKLESLESHDFGGCEVLGVLMGVAGAAFVSEDPRVSLVNETDAPRRKMTKSRMPRKNPNP
jgi:hypothetical protein